MRQLTNMEISHLHIDFYKGQMGMNMQLYYEAILEGNDRRKEWCIKEMSRIMDTVYCLQKKRSNVCAFQKYGPLCNHTCVEGHCDINRCTRDQLKDRDKHEFLYEKMKGQMLP